MCAICADVFLDIEIEHASSEYQFMITRTYSIPWVVLKKWPHYIYNGELD